MTNFDKRKLCKMVLYFLNKTNGPVYYHVFKIIYFANIAHLAKFGLRITTDDFCALPDTVGGGVINSNVNQNSPLRCRIMLVHSTTRFP